MNGHKQESCGEMRVKCGCGDTHEVYDGYRHCPYFKHTVDILARKHGVEPVHILSTGKWTQPVSDEELGLIG